MLNDVTLVVLAGGLGSRLRGLLGQQSKSLIGLHHGAPLAVLLARQFLDAGASVIIVADLKTAQGLRPHLSMDTDNLQFRYDHYAGTSGALTLGIQYAMTTRIVVANADTIVPCNLVDWSSSLSVATATQLLLPMGVQNSGLVGFDARTHKVAHWGEVDGTPAPPDLRPMSSTGVYIINRDWWLCSAPTAASSLEREVVPRLIPLGLLDGFELDDPLPAYDFGTELRFRYLVHNKGLRSDLLARAGLIATRSTASIL